MTRFGTTRYGEAKYGTIEYGEVSVFSGVSLGEEVFPSGSLSGTVDFSWRGLLEDTAVENNHVECVYSGVWTHLTGQTGPSSGTLSSTSAAGANLVLEYIGSIATIRYRTASAGGNATYTITRLRDNFVAGSGTINMNSPSTVDNVLLNIPLAFDRYRLVITRSAGTIFFDSLVVRCTDVEFDIRAKDNNNVWTNWTRITYTAGSGNLHTGTTPNYNNMVSIQIRTRLISSVLVNSPLIESVHLQSGNVNFFAPIGTWVTEQDLGATFTSFDNIEWTPLSQPENTTLTIQTSTRVGGIWNQYSNPYSTIPNQVQLRPNELAGSITTPLLTPLHLQHSTFNWETIRLNGFLPQNGTITWDVLDINNNAIVSNLAFSDIATIQTITAPVRIRTRIQRISVGDNSPTLNNHSLLATVVYTQSIQTDGAATTSANISRVFGNRTGIREARTIAQLNFAVPPMVTGETYTLTNQTGRSDIVSVYWHSEANTPDNRTNVTTNRTDRVFALSVGPTHLQHRSGDVFFGSPRNIVFGGTFHPPLPSSVNHYAYLLINGWGSPETINQQVVFSWLSGGTAFGSLISTVSRFNGTPENDTVQIVSNSGPNAQDTPWISNVLIYEGHVNQNYLDIKQDFNIQEVLPRISPEVRTAPNPYIIEFVENSIKENNITISDEIGQERIALQLAPQSVNTLVSGEPVVRGNTNQDFLSQHNVLEIVRISNTQTGAASYHLNVDYVLVHNAIDWSPNGLNPTLGATYFVTYRHTARNTGIITASSNYMHNIITGERWVSPLLRNYHNNMQNHTEMSCAPSNDFISTPLPIKTNNVWGTIPSTVNRDTLRYNLHDNNPLVVTFLEEVGGSARIVGTVGDKRPSWIWSPNIHDGHYYLGKDEYYLFTQPSVFHVPADGIINSIVRTLEIPYTPAKQAPIIIKKPNGDSLRQVAFSRESDNQYVTYLTENVILDGTSTITLSYGNIDPAFPISITYGNGLSLFVIDSNVQDNQIEIALSAQEIMQLKGQQAQVTYQPKDCFVVEYNTSSQSSVRLTFSEHYPALTIISEAENAMSYYMAHELELNPLKTSLPGGFVYLTDKDEPASHIDIDSNPSILVANGHSRATVLINVYDKYGNPTTANIHVRALLGTITSYSSISANMASNLAKSTGRYVYIYTSPASIQTTTQIDKIIVTDEQGIAREQIITLVGAGGVL